MSKYAGSYWIQNFINDIPISAFGFEVAELLGELYRGIYHVDGEAMRRVDWADNKFIELVVTDGGSWATFDFDWLTRLVVLAHDRCIRVEIGAASPRHLRLSFSKRQRDGGRPIWRLVGSTDRMVEESGQEVGCGGD